MSTMARVLCAMSATRRRMNARMRISLSSASRCTSARRCPRSTVTTEPSTVTRARTSPRRCDNMLISPVNSPGPSTVMGSSRPSTGRTASTAPSVTTKKRMFCSPKSNSTSPARTLRRTPTLEIRSICAGVSRGNIWCRRSIYGSAIAPHRAVSSGATRSQYTRCPRLLGRRLHRQRKLVRARARRGQRKAHGGPLAFLARDLELAALRQHEVLDDGQAEPGAAELPRARLVDAVEALGDPWQVRARDTDAGVAHAELHAGPIERPRAHGDPAALRRVLHRVVYEINEDLREAIVIGVDADVSGLDVGDQPHPSGLRFGADDVENGAEHVGEAHRRQAQRDLAELDVGQVHEVVEEPTETLRVA